MPSNSPTGPSSINGLFDRREVSPVLIYSNLEQYLEMISNRPSPSSQGLTRHDKIISINISGPSTAFAIVQCAIPPRYFTDYLTLLKTSEGWQIISKTFHTDAH